MSIENPTAWCHHEDGTEHPLQPDGDGMYSGCYDDPEPLSLPDLHDLIRETAEALVTLVEHVHALKHQVDYVVTATGADLAFVADRLGAAWAACRVAQTAAQELAAVQS